MKEKHKEGWDTGYYTIMILLGLVIIGIIWIGIDSTVHMVKENKESETLNTNIYCQESIKCEQECNQYENENFMSCRYKCMTLKNCD